MRILNSILTEINQDNELAKVGITVAAGIVAAIGIKSMYNKKKKDAIIKKFGENDKKNTINYDLLPDILLTGNDVYKHMK